MTDDAPKIIPFGKYKGRLVEELLVDDPAYLMRARIWFTVKPAVKHRA